MDKYIEILSVFPEEKDRLFSERLWQDTVAIARDELGMSELAIEIAEKYDNEENPHYHIFWVDLDFSKHFSEFYPEDMEFSICYRATADGKSHNGTVKMRVFTDRDNGTNITLLEKLFDIYNSYILEYYPEWDTEYIENSKKCDAIVTEIIALPKEGGTITFS
jgi:hypothetical protein